MSSGRKDRAVVAQSASLRAVPLLGNTHVGRKEDLTMSGLRKILRLSSVTHPQASSAPGTQGSATVRRQQQRPAFVIPEWPSPVPSRAPTTVVAVAETGKSRGGGAEAAPRQHKPVASKLRAWVLLLFSVFRRGRWRGDDGAVRVIYRSGVQRLAGVGRYGRRRRGKRRLSQDMIEE